jgi:hypothetical protein
MQYWEEETGLFHMSSSFDECERDGESELGSKGSMGRRKSEYCIQSTECEHTVRHHGFVKSLVAARYSRVAQ